jgi:phospholipid/cholesterol/gamma-HCH transport system substrate-binding protein
MTDLKANFTRLDRIIGRTDTLSAGFNHKESTISLLMRDRVLYDRLLKSSAQLDSLLNDVRKNPKRYFKFSVF